MLLGVPNEVDGLGFMNEKLQDYPLHEAVTKAKMGKRMVHLTMPKFKIESDMDIKDAIIAVI